MEQRKKKVPVFLRQAIRQGIGVTIAVLLGYAIADTLGGEPHLKTLTASPGLVQWLCQHAHEITIDALKAVVNCWELAGCEPSKQLPPASQAWSAAITCDVLSVGSREKTGVQWLQGCKWAAITVVVVASPMLGKVSQVRAFLALCIRARAGLT